MPVFLGVDIGGTFTDSVAVDVGGKVFHAKTLSTKEDPSQGMLAGLDVLAASSGLDRAALLAAADRLSHGTTIGTNIAVERNGASVGLITTRGSRDALFMMRGTGRFADLSPEQIYNIQKTSMPVPLVARQCVLELDERIDRQGRIVTALNPRRTRAEVAEFLKRTDVGAVAICFLWSFRNPVHENLVAEIVRSIAPHVFVSLSNQTAPRVGEYERTVATVLNSYVGPSSTKYLKRTGDQLKSDGLEGPLLIMQANGGVVPASAAATAPLSLIGSGPAGGLVGSAMIAKSSGHKNVIATDMGGTSFDVGLIVDHVCTTTDRRLLGKYSYLQPAIDVRSIACGGGSIAYFDEHSASMRVGPKSAGSEPGPACYGRGGTLPTVTDADVVLGFIRPDGFLGGNMPLSRSKAIEAVGALAARLGVSVEEAAAGIVRLNNHNAATLIRQQTLERGYDTRNFVVYAFGGAGPVHAFGIGQELGIKEIVIPLGNGASTLSAYGIASSAIVQYFEREVSLRAPFAAADLSAEVQLAEVSARQGVLDLNLDPSVTRFERFVLMRYAEQRMHSLDIGLPQGAIDDAVAKSILAAFDAEYARQYGEAARVLKQTAEVFAIRIRAVQHLDFSESNLAEGRAGDDGGLLADARRADRKVYWPTSMRYMNTQVFDGLRVPIGEDVAGPAIIELPHTSVVVDIGQHVVAELNGGFTIKLP